MNIVQTILHKLNDLGIFNRLLMSFLILFLIMVGFGGFAFKQMTELHEITDDLYNHPFRTTSSLLEAKAIVYNNLLTVRGIIQECENTLTGARKNGIPADIERSMARIELLHQEVHALDRRFQSQITIAQESFTGDKKLIQQLNEQYQRWVAYHDETYRIAYELGNFELAWKRTYDKHKNPVFVLFNQLDNAADFSRNDADNYFVKSQAFFKGVLVETITIASVIILLFLAISFFLARSITTSMLRFRESILRVADGDFNAQVPFLSYSNELGEISRSLETLRIGVFMQEEYAQTKTSVAEIARALQTCTSYQELGNAVTHELAPLMNLVYGAFYTSDNARSSLMRAGGYACDDNIHSRHIEWGQGLIGQAALDKLPILQRFAADEGTCTTISMGKLSIQNILIVPVVHHGEVLGVIELGSLQAFTEAHRNMLDMLLPAIAISLEILAGNLETQHALEESQTLTRVLEKLAAELGDSQAALVQTEERSRLILGSVSEGIWGMDIEGKTTFVNQAAANMVGYSLEELTGKSMHALIHYAHSDGSEYPPSCCPVLQTFKDGISRHITDEVFWRKSGIPFSVEYTTTPLHKDDNLVGVVVVFRDITERKQTEVAMLEAKLAAEDATRMKSDFLANMSHEIRTPMNAIIGMTHLALQTELTSKQRNYMGKVDSAAKGLLGIINGILDFSKIEAGKMELERIDFSLEDVMEHLADLSVIKAQEKGLELLFDIGADVPTSLVGDPLRLGQVLTNLVNNAIKFTEKGEIIVGIHQVPAGTETTADIADGVLLRFNVTDSGVGLTENQRNRLFTAFSQADSSTTRKHGGTGLGLTICKRLVEMMEGEINVESAPGIGSTFIFTAKFGVQSQQKRLDTSSIDTQGLRILVVDDNASAREIFITMLASLKFEAFAVSNGIEAIGELEQAQMGNRPYGLVLMDWHMPGMDGVETIRRIRADKRLAQTPACMMVTAYSRDELLQQLADIQVAGLLVKPVSPSTLFDNIMTTFGKTVVAPLKRRRMSDRQDAAKSLRGAYVLLVEDNEVNQELAMEILLGAGLRVDLAGNGEQALEKIGQAEYDGVLMDCQMPVMDGFEATRKIRADGRFNTLPVIAMTANAMAGDRERCLDCGMNDHIAKPIDVINLFSTLARWVKPRTPVVDTQGESAMPAEMDIPRLEDVDTGAALVRIGGNLALYRKLLTRFGEVQADVVERIREAVRASDYDTATRLAHTLKGLAGNIGAGRLSHAASGLELALKNREDDKVEALTAEVEAPLRVLIAEINRVLPHNNAETEHKPAGSLDMAALNPLLQQITQLLMDDDSLAAKQIEPIAALLKGTALENDFHHLGKLVSQYDFEAALELLRSITARL